jgi:hypothetical protein
VRRLTAPQTQSQSQIQPQSQPPARPRPQAQPRTPTPAPIEVEVEVKDEEPGTEHEIRREERHKEERVFDWRDDVNTRITMKMNQFANLLKTKRIGRPTIEGPEWSQISKKGKKKLTSSRKSWKHY